MPRMRFVFRDAFGLTVSEGALMNMLPLLKTEWVRALHR